MRLIDADKLLKQVRLCLDALKEVDATFDFLWGYTSALHAMEDIIENAPTITPETEIECEILQPDRWLDTI